MHISCARERSGHNHHRKSVYILPFGENRCLWGIPPFLEFPPGLVRLRDGYYRQVDKGFSIDKSEESPVSDEKVVEHCRDLEELGIKSNLVAGVFSPIGEIFHREGHVWAIVLRELPQADVTCPDKVANMGFKERENASILNA